ncbi:hypothetical protein DPX16_14791 [Anabarilius grahami]|uniref:Uncharacterized protein n=1 Tax=Anabarilius grahami TaxID=495550 RepID=A0A3N0XN21_ANAGA|nr:hypothetical protein DPX16_14791 [Anabarilius grahami]
MTSLKTRPGSIKGAPREAVSISSSSGTVLSDCDYFEPVADEGELLDDDDVLSLTSSDPAASALLASSPREQEMANEEEAGEPAETSKPPCPAHAELLEVMERGSGRLQLPWERVKKGAARGRLDERFLSGHNTVAPVSLPFLPDLHVEIEKAWKNPYLARIHQHQRANFSDVEGLSQHGSDAGPKQTGGPGPSRFEDRRQGQKSSVASRAPAPPRSRSQRRWDSRRKKQDLSEEIKSQTPAASVIDFLSVRVVHIYPLFFHLLNNGKKISKHAQALLTVRLRAGPMMNIFLMARLLA